MRNLHDKSGYNDRLFSKGLRARLHLARFSWVKRVAQTTRHDRILELGCFDGRLLDYVKPSRYVGIDAGWEGGIQNALDRHGNDTTKTFIKTDAPSVLCQFPARCFELGVALETLEHLPDDTLGRYLEQVQRTCARFLVTVPNEKGPVFLAKWIAKRTLLRNNPAETYSLTELFNATLCRMDRVARHEHKGFDYAALAGRLANHFDIEKVEGLPWGPPFFAFSVAFVMTSR